ncbi:guanylate kinase [Mycoplasma sp. Ms02]|uniref:guanylate kinase n=1 Tax=Mycoplasma sp. Ms02 TaxID=353851 RepID=UPI001C895895|nr:guanylate kinase [Mycoplasma sp. Ms02]QZE12633.1 guanylate kinase [Mycoplasma sp. Ms02]
MLDKKIPIIVFTGPSGVGKGTVERLLFQFEDLDIRLSCSATTRKPRSGEINGIHYYFMDRSIFQQKIKGREFIEFSYHFDNYYGTLFRELKKIDLLGKIPMLEIETRGARQIIEKLKDDPRFKLITIFLLPPTIQDLKERIIKRGSEDDDTLRIRLEKAQEEMRDSEIFKYKVVNHVPQQAADQIRDIILKEIKNDDI